MAHTLSSLLPFKIFVVHGHSMEPTLREGDRVLALTWCYLLSKPKKGEIIVFKDAEQTHDKYIIKRISKVQGHSISVKGDNKHDSLKLKAIKQLHIIGKVIRKY